MAKINETLKQLRLDRGMTQEEVAGQLNVTRQALSSYESGRTQPTLDTLQRLADIYDTELMDIIYGKLPTGRLYKVLKITAVVVSTLLLLTLLAEALGLWIPNRFYSPEDVPKDEIMAIFEIRKDFEAFRDICYWLSGLLALCGFTALLVLSLCLPRPLSAKSKLRFAGGLALGLIAVVLPWAMTDTLFGTGNYRIMLTVNVLPRLFFALLLSLIIDTLRLRRRKPARQKKA